MKRPVAITTEPINTADVLASVQSPAHGAAILFVGTVRDVNDGKPVDGIDYSAYTSMAEREMQSIVAEAESRVPGAVVAIVHRVGALGLGDASVAIATAHAHRDEAYVVSRYVIEAIKARVPIWKREHYVDGTRQWVNADDTPVTAEVSG